MEELGKSCQANSSREKQQNIVLIRTEETKTFLVILTAGAHGGEEWS